MGEKIKVPKQVVYICKGSKCSKKGYSDIKKDLKKVVKQKGLKSKVLLVSTLCTDNCDLAPVVCFQPQNQWEFYADQEEMANILEKIAKEEL